MTILTFFGYVLIGTAAGIIGYYIADGWMALREHRRRFRQETDKYL